MMVVYLSTLVLSLCATVLAVGPPKSVNIDALIDSTINLRTHSLFAPYVDQDLQNRWFSFGGDAYVNTNKHIRLTRDRPSETGWLWSRLPMSTSNFQIDVEFKLSGGSGHLYGDGMAMWLTTRRAESGPVFGFIDEFEGLGLFFDTFANSHHNYALPRISAMMGDGKTAYDHNHDGVANELAGCSVNIWGTDIATKLRVTYIKGRYLDVKVQFRAWDEWTPCFTLEDITLPTSPFLGFSALTGEAHEAHDIVTVTASSLVLTKPLTGTEAKAAKKASSAANPYGSESTSFFGTLFSFLIKVVVVCVIGAVGFVGWKAYAVRTGASMRGMGGGGIPWDNKRF